MFVLLQLLALAQQNIPLLINRVQIVLLLEIVDPDLLNVKWKQVSETIVSLGGSYKFGPSTCKKQYMRLVANGRARSLTESALGRISVAKTVEAGNARTSNRSRRR